MKKIITPCIVATTLFTNLLADFSFQDMFKDIKKTAENMHKERKEAKEKLSNELIRAKLSTRNESIESKNIRTSKIISSAKYMEHFR